MATKFYYGKNGEMLAEDEKGNVSEIITMGNYCFTDAEREAWRKKTEREKQKAEIERKKQTARTH